MPINFHEARGFNCAWPGMAQQFNPFSSISAQYRNPQFYHWRPPFHTTGAMLVRTYAANNPIMPMGAEGAAVGSSIKTWEGVLYAQIKTIDSLVKASMKNWNGLP
jgi:hypothetical protein